MFALIAIGIVSGFLSGLLGIGGGVVLIPALISVAGLTTHQAVCSSLIIIIPTALVGIIKIYSNLEIQWSIIALVTSGAVCGSFLGSSFGQTIDASTFRKIFAVFLIVVGIKLLFFTQDTGR
jgi:uncharacterized protein